MTMTSIPLSTAVWKRWLKADMSTCGHEHDCFGLLIAPHQRMCETCLLAEVERRRTEYEDHCARCGSESELKQFQSGIGSGGVGVHVFFYWCWNCEMENNLQHSGAEVER